MKSRPYVEEFKAAIDFSDNNRLENNVGAFSFLCMAYPGWLVNALPGEIWGDVPLTLIKRINKLTIDPDLLSLTDYIIAQYKLGYNI